MYSMKATPSYSLFLETNMVVGYHELPLWTNFLSYWTDLAAPFYSSALPRNRLSQILTNIDVNGIASIPKSNTDKCAYIEKTL